MALHRPEFGTCLPRRQVPVLAWRPWEIAILQVTTITRVKDDFCLSFKNQYSKKSGRVFVVFLIAGGDFDTFSKIEVKSWGLYTNKSTFWNLLVPKLRKVDYINTVASLIFGLVLRKSMKSKYREMKYIRTWLFFDRDRKWVGAWGYLTSRIIEGRDLERCWSAQL